MSRRRIAEIPPDTPIPLSMAGDIVGKGRSTLYAWVERGILKPTETPDGMTVTPRQVREAEAAITRGRPRRRKIGKAGQSEIGCPVD